MNSHKIGEFAHTQIIVSPSILLICYGDIHSENKETSLID